MEWTGLGRVLALPRPCCRHPAREPLGRAGPGSARVAWPGGKRGVAGCLGRRPQTSVWPALESGAEGGLGQWGDETRTGQRSRVKAPRGGPAQLAGGLRPAGRTCNRAPCPACRPFSGALMMAHTLRVRS